MSRPPEAVQRHPHRPPCRRVCPTFRRRPRTTGQPDRPLPAGWETPSVSSTRIITRRRGDQAEAFRKDRPPHFLRDPETKPTVAPPGAPFLTAKDGRASHRRSPTGTRRCQRGTAAPGHPGARAALGKGPSTARAAAGKAGSSRQAHPTAPPAATSRTGLRLITIKCKLPAPAPEHSSEDDKASSLHAQGQRSPEAWCLCFR